MLFPLFLVSCLFLAVFGYEDAAPTYAAKDYTSWKLHHVEGSKRANIYVPFKDAQGNDDFISMIRLDLVGDAYARGFAHGALLAPEIVEFTGPKMDEYLRQTVMDIDISIYPEPLQDILKVLKTKGVINAPEIAKQAMAWVWDQEEAYLPSSLITEIQGIADGMCSVLGKDCDAAKWNQLLREVNMFPELIRMACTAFGAWGKATTTKDTLVQLRALDFGGGPFSNYTVLYVHRNDPNNDNAFASIFFPGFVGAITGVSQHGIGISEKVWMTYDTPDLQPGSYQGEADVFILREILEYSKSKAEAVDFLANAKRTWAIWIGIGEYPTLTFDLVGYTQNSSIAYSDKTMPAMTGQPYIDSIAYVDKHPQPSHDGPTGSLPTSLQDFWGNISLDTTKIITKYHQTGDVQIASYDFGHKSMNVAIGRVNAKGEYGPEGSTDLDQWKAYNRPYVNFNLLDLWAGI